MMLPRTDSHPSNSQLSPIDDPVRRRGKTALGRHRVSWFMGLDLIQLRVRGNVTLLPYYAVQFGLGIAVRLVINEWP
jgi:hypothetical protein